MNLHAKLFLAAVCICGALVGFTLARFSQERSAGTKPEAERDDANPGISVQTVSITPTPAASDQLHSIAVKQLLDKIDAVRKASSASALHELKIALAEAGPHVAIAAITEFLRTGRDVSTGVGFEIGENGTLADAPSLRVFLLDQLGQLARQAGTGEGASVAREILATKNSPDEWAVALRNVAWSDSTSSGFLAGKMREMLSYQPWRSTPGAAMQEAFDLIVYTKDASFIPDLEAMVGGDNLALQRAAAVALDRLAETAPAVLMNYLNSNPTLFADRPLVRADYFAKADLGDNTQRQLFENYLSRPDASIDEKTKAIDELIEPGTFVSESLLTTAEDKITPEQRAATLEKVTREWLAGKRFSELQNAIAELHARAAE